MIQLKNIHLTYTAYYDRSSSLKEFLINFLHRRKYSSDRTKEVKALDNVSLTIKEGERVGIIGRNGAGKSTLLKVLGKILKPTSGVIKIDGTIQPLIEIAAGFNPEFSGRENIYLNGYMLGFTKRMIKQKENEIIEFSELSEFIDIPVKYYSTGMAVKLAFSIATSIDPEILIFDEMLSAGDAAFFNKAKARMDALINKAKLVVLVSHDLNLIRSFTTRTLVIHQGKIVFDGPPEEAVTFYLSSIDAEIEKIASIHNFAKVKEEENTTTFSFEIITNQEIRIEAIKAIVNQNSTHIEKITIESSKSQLAHGVHKFQFSIKNLAKEVEYAIQLKIDFTSQHAGNFTSSSNILKIFELVKKTYPALVVSNVEQIKFISTPDK